MRNGRRFLNRALDGKRANALLAAMFAVVASICFWMPADAGAGQLQVAAAADLTFVFKDVAAKFEKETGSQVKLTYGSSGNFFSQIQNGAPFDVFFSADVSFPKRLAAAGLIEPGTIYNYARGEIVIWVPNASKLDLSKGLSVLLDPAIRKIAIANPIHAPYGAAAIAALQHDKIFDQVKSKFVLGENISQTAQFVQSGNADVGIVALSLALAPAMKTRGRYVIVPPDDYPPLIQAAVIIKSSPNKELAKKFLEFIKQPGTVALMARYGFTLPEAMAAADHGGSMAAPH